MSKQVGADIRALRKSRGMTLQTLSGAVGRSVGWLSQIERGQTEPSVRDLGRIAEQFGLSINIFFRSADRTEAERGLVLRAGDRTAIGSDSSGLREELLSPTLSGSFEIIRSVFAPGSDSAGPLPDRGTENGGVLLSGRLRLSIGDRTFTLEPGDCFQFSGESYEWENPGTEPAEVIWIVAPPIY